MKRREVMGKLIVKHHLQAVFEKLVSTLVLPGKAPNGIMLTISETSGLSFANGTHLQVGLPDSMMDAEENEQLITLYALLGHEAEHFNRTSFKGFIAYQQRVVRAYHKKYPNLTTETLEWLQKLAADVANIIEDGRIEYWLGERLRGFVPWLRFVNIRDWEQSGEWAAQVPENERDLRSFISRLFSYSLLGIEPHTPIESSVADAIFEQTLSHIQKGIREVWSFRALQEAERVVEKMEPLLVPYFQYQSDGESADEEGDLSSSSADGNSKNASFPETHFQPERMGDFQNTRGDEKEANSEGAKERPTDDKFNNTHPSESSHCPPSQPNESERTSHTNQNRPDSTENIENATSEYSPSATWVTIDESRMKEGEETPQEQLREEITRQRESLKQQLTRQWKHEKNQIVSELKAHAIPPLHRKADLSDLSKMEAERLMYYYGEPHLTYAAVYQPLSLVPVPLDWTGEGRKFRQQVERLFAARSPFSQRHQTRGTLDARQLYRVAMKETTLFSKKGHPEQADAVVYILEDYSGSMEGHKAETAKRALVTIEEGLKGVVPFKIVGFDARVTEQGVGVQHVIIKNFDENQVRGSYAYSSWLQYKSVAHRMNKDGFSIRVATEELKRRTESKKLLLVLSDGLPTAYGTAPDQKTRKQIGILDVEAAVKEARKADVQVVALGIGVSESEREAYRHMYQKHFWFCELPTLSTQLTRIIGEALR